MKNINLKNKDLLKKQMISNSLATNFSVVILSISFLVYGIVFLLNYLVVSKEERIKNEVVTIEKDLAEKDFAEMYDFNMKLLDLKLKIGSQGLLGQTKNIIAISNNTLPSVHFTKLRVENKGSFSSYTIEAAFSSYEELANQIREYKKMEKISNFFLDSSKEEDEKLTAEFSFDLGDYVDLEELATQPVEDF